MHILDSVLSQALLQYISRKLRIPPRFRNSSDVTHHLDFEALKNRDKVGERARRMPDRVDSSHRLWGQPFWAAAAFQAAFLRAKLVK
jgi:hypothetical protein